jgi:hypothetical protein
MSADFVHKLAAATTHWQLAVAGALASHRTWSQNFLNFGQILSCQVQHTAGQLLTWSFVKRLLQLPACVCSRLIVQARCRAPQESEHIWMHSCCLQGQASQHQPHERLAQHSGSCCVCRPAALLEVSLRCCPEPVVNLLLLLLLPLFFPLRSAVCRPGWGRNILTGLRCKIASIISATSPDELVAPSKSLE